MKQHFFHEQYRSERSKEIAAACSLTDYSVSVVFYDLALRRRYSRSLSYGTEITAAAAWEELKTLFVSAVAEFGIGDDVKKVGIAAKFAAESCIENLIDRAELGIPDDTEIMFVPFISAGIGGVFTASLLTITEDDYIAAEFGRTLYIARKAGTRLQCAAFSLSGAFDGSGLESGMPAEKGAIDAVRRDKDGTVSYEVVGDVESAGISPCAAAMAAVIMQRTGVLDEDGIMVDRDLFYVGEDYFVSQTDIRAIQADKAGTAAAFEVFLGKKEGFLGGNSGSPHSFDEKDKNDNEKAVRSPKLYFSGEIFSDARGLKSLSELGAIPEDALKCAFCRNSAEQGIILFLEDEALREKAYRIAESAEDITDRLFEAYDQSYFEHLGWF